MKISAPAGHCIGSFNKKASRASAHCNPLLFWALPCNAVCRMQSVFICFFRNAQEFGRYLLHWMWAMCPPCLRLSPGLGWAAVSAHRLPPHRGGALSNKALCKTAFFLMFFHQVLLFFTSSTHSRLAPPAGIVPMVGFASARALKVPVPIGIKTAFTIFAYIARSGCKQGIPHLISRISSGA